VGTRLQDFTTGSWALFQNPRRRLLSLNVQPYDAAKHRAATLVADAAVGLAALDQALGDYRAPDAWTDAATQAKAAWQEAAAAATAAGNSEPPSDAQVIGAVQRAVGPDAVVVCAAGGLPGELHKLWRAGAPGSYHLEYGYSCMGYEIAGGLGVKLARPDAEVVVMVGDGSYLMLNSEIATSVMLGLKLTSWCSTTGASAASTGCSRRPAVRLQQPAGAERAGGPPRIDFAAHAAALGAAAEKVSGLAELEAAVARARAAPRSSVIVIDTDPAVSTAAGGHWWDVAVPEVSERDEVRKARASLREGAR
jgi:3D-(3,5/4)-trihydroxycyclohexane-1,2-dione acylhydrolase (decyclizing)